MSKSSGMKFKVAMLRRGLLHSWAQFIAVFCMATLSVLAYTGLEGGWRGMQVSLQDYAESSSMAKVWIQAIHVEEAQLNEAKKIPGVDAVEKRVIRSAEVASGNGDTSWLSLTSTANADSWRVSVPSVVDGEPVTDAGEGIWVSPRYRDANELVQGNQLTLTVAAPGGRREVTVPIRGIVRSPDQLYDVKESLFLVPEPGMFSYGFITPATAQKLWDPSWEDAASNSILVSGDDSSETVDKLWDCLDEQGLRITTRQTDSHISAAYDRVTVIRNVSMLFSALFLLVGVLAMYSSTRRLVDSELKTIATLQSMGYGRGELRLHFSMFGMLAGVAGSVVGLAVAPLLSRVVLRSQLTQFDLPHWRVAYTWAPLLVAVLVVVACVAGGYLASGSALTRSPALLMRPGLVRASRAATRLRRLGNGHRYGIRWAIRDTASNIARFLMGIIGVAGCLMLLFTGFGLPDTMQNRAESSFSADSMDYDFRVDMGGLPQVTTPIEGLGSNPQAIMQMPVMTDPSDGYDRVVTVLDENDRFHLRTQDDQAVVGDGLWVTSDTAERLRLDAGSPVRLRLPRGLGDLDLTVSGIVSAEMPQGFFMSRQGWESLGMVFSPTSMLVGSDADVTQVLDDPRVLDVVSRADQQSNSLNIKESLGDIFNLMRVMAILLCIIVLYSLGSLTFDERQRQYATLSVLGMSPGELRRLSSVEVVASALIGVVLGIPGGAWFLDLYLAQFASPRLQYLPYITSLSVTLAVVIAVSSALVTTIALGSRIAGINMVDALKEAE